MKLAHPSTLDLQRNLGLAFAREREARRYLRWPPAYGSCTRGRATRKENVPGSGVLCRVKKRGQRCGSEQAGCNRNELLLLSHGWILLGKLWPSIAKYEPSTPCLNPQRNLGVAFARECEVRRYL